MNRVYDIQIFFLFFMIFMTPWLHAFFLLLRDKETDR